MPLEIPGAPLGILADKKRTGKCPSCRRTYRSVKVLKIKNDIRYFCPYCGKTIKKSLVETD